ncbi:MAG: bifunctional phosphopantothenoylcysteine decarboxylase/phosphopantothenate--cysteine ligase CoaBC [Bacteroidia bacterium]|nr:bifunctional phosphopantothenoylcysteine decarboxylase/phosphopantothenate--cysteine ligase CoaBC [Bacteroidia bacterium]
MLKGKKIVLGVTASIAAYKAVFLLRLLQKAGAEVKVVTTPSVEKFVGELSFSALTKGNVFSDLWNEGWSEHVGLGTWADLLLVVPATANTLAKFAHGLCDNALTAVYLAAPCPVMVAPAMDADMYVHPRTQANLEILQKDGVHVLPVGDGFLASGLQGPGRLMEAEDILTAVQTFFGEKPLAGTGLLLTAGPTREAIDPVRYITNHSTGKMGYALAEEAARLGAEVTIVSGPTQLELPKNIYRIDVQSAQEMYEAVHQNLQDKDVVIMTAAVADYTPLEVSHQKIKKAEGDLNIPLKRTRDILKSVGAIKKSEQILVGFALETHNELDNAKKKLQSKNLDFVVLNSMKDAGAGFGHDTNKLTLLFRDEEQMSFPLKSKKELAKDILQQVIRLRKQKNNT